MSRWTADRFMHKDVETFGVYTQQEMEEANPFRKAKIKFAGIIPRTGYVKFSNVEMKVQTFALLEYLRLTKQIHYWYTDDGIGASDETVDDDLPTVKDLDEGENWL